MGPMDILLVDDHNATREEILALITAEADLDVIGEATNGDEAVREAERLKPDLIVMDIIMPGMNGIDATKMIRDSNANVAIIVLSNHAGRQLLQAVMAAGATGYVRKDQAYEELIPAIRAVAGGEQYVGSRIDE